MDLPQSISNTLQIAGKEIPVITCHTVIIGSGASAFAAANRLRDFGLKDIVMISEGLNDGTSRNTGSDKQTYYKLTQSGGQPDSVEALAETLFTGGGMDGDLALIEAANSSRCFYYLCEAGVPFPYNEFGEYPGYQTDHDTNFRATSAGPLTSRYMTEKLQARAERLGVSVLDGYRIISLLTEGDRCLGVLAIEKESGAYLVVRALNTIFATGGPASIYANAVYPKSQSGATGVAVRAGVPLKNFGEWQYGIASTSFRWNLSGTYQQVLPRYISTDAHLNDPQEFLEDHFKDADQLLNAIFLKGYQWPFDPRKIDGSSIIDILVHREIFDKGRRVFLDFTTNPQSLGDEGDFTAVTGEAYEYLAQSGALFGTPIQRLAHMNQRAIDLYRSNGIDLTSEWLEISVCAQHCNGGLQADINWQSPLKGFFPIGEVNGSHGVYRPGGSALNSGQVGALRASSYIATHAEDLHLDKAAFTQAIEATVQGQIIYGATFTNYSEGAIDLEAIHHELGTIMSRYCAHIRSADYLTAAKNALTELHQRFLAKGRVKEEKLLYKAFEIQNNFDTAFALIAAIEEYIVKQGGRSRGSYLILDEDTPRSGGRDLADSVQEIYLQDGEHKIVWRKVRQIPQRDLWFENVWREFLRHDHA